MTRDELARLRIKLRLEQPVTPDEIEQLLDHCDDEPIRTAHLHFGCRCQCGACQECEG